MMILGWIVPLLAMGAFAYALGWRPQLNQLRPAKIGQSPVELLKLRSVRGEISHPGVGQLRRDL